MKTEEDVEEQRKKRSVDMLRDMKEGIAKKIDLNKQYAFGVTYLHVAAVCGCVACCATRVASVRTAIAPPLAGQWMKRIAATPSRVGLTFL